MRPDTIKPQTRKIWDMSLQGMTAPEISRKLGLKFALVNSAVRRGREKGVIKRRFNKNPLKRKGIAYMRLGSISEITNGLSIEQLNDLIDSASKCGCQTVSEYVLELVRDAHANGEFKK